MGNTVQPNGRRVFNDAITHPQDSQDLADDIYEIGNVRVGSSAERQSFPTAQTKPGMMWSETDTGDVYQYLAGAWVAWKVSRPWTALTASTGWTAEGSASNRPEVSREGRTVSFRGRLYGGTAGTVAAVVPDWARPTRNLRPLIADAATPAGAVSIQIETNGNLRIWSYPGGAAVTQWSVT